MLEIIFKILPIQEWYGISENIEIAKGKYKLPSNAKEAVTKYKRELKWRLKDI